MTDQTTNEHTINEKYCDEYTMTIRATKHFKPRGHTLGNIPKVN